jgi:hypothetical protein
MTGSGLCLLEHPNMKNTSNTVRIDNPTRIFMTSPLSDYLLSRLKLQTTNDKKYLFRYPATNKPQSLRHPENKQGVCLLQIIFLKI